MSSPEQPRTANSQNTATLECPGISEAQDIKDMYDFVSTEIATCEDKFEEHIKKDPNYNIIPSWSSITGMRGDIRYLFIITPTQIVGMRHDNASNRLKLIDQINIHLDEYQPCMSYYSESPQDSPLNHVDSIREFIAGFTQRQ